MQHQMSSFDSLVSCSLTQTLSNSLIEPNLPSRRSAFVPIIPSNQSDKRPRDFDQLPPSVSVFF
jgi:hypothetical protein